MNEELREKIQGLYCKWCPQDCQGLTKEEMLGCLASGGFYDDVSPLLEQVEQRGRWLTAKEHQGQIKEV